MRSTIFTALALASLVSCGAAQKPADSADTSSLEGKNAGGGDTSEARGGDKPADNKASDEKPRAAAAAPSTKADGPAPPAPGSGAHPAPAVTGLIDGKPFSPKVARVVGKPQKDGRVLLALDESHSDCTSTASPQPGDGTLTMLVPWQDGYKVDLGSLKRATPKKSGAEITFARAGASGKREISASFKPSGLVTILKAPSDSTATGKMNIDMQSGDYMLAGDLDVLVCPPAK